MEHINKNTEMKKYFWLLPILIFFLVGCENTPYNLVDSNIYIQKEGREKKDWKLIWQDDFNTQQIDTSKWTVIPPGKVGWNKYMTKDEQCYNIKEGKLYLRGIVNNDTLSDPRKFLTGGIWTKGKFAFQYGKIEIRAKLESAQGAWPAIWMLAEQEKYGDYPRNGEIDIMEHINFENRVFQTTHSYYTIELKQKENPPHYGTADADMSKFNTFGLEWYPDKIVFTLNENKTFEYPRIEGVDPTQWPYDQPFFVLIDQQLGGKWAGDVNPQDLPVDMIIDYVKVYQ